MLNLSVLRVLIPGASETDCEQTSTPMLHRPTASGPVRGFSSIEFMGAAVIILVMSTVAITAFQLYERRQPLTSSAKRLTQACSTARAFAISNNAIFSVQISLDQGNFWIDETDTTGIPIVPKVTRPEKIEDQVVLQDVFFGASQARQRASVVSVRFFPDGSSDDARIYLRLISTDEDDDDSYLTVRVYGPTGLARIFDKQRMELPVATAPATGGTP